MKRNASITAGLFLLLDLGACVFPDKQIGDGDDEASTTDPSDSDSDTVDSETGEATDSPDGDTGLFDECEGPFPDSSFDQDCDEVGLSCDNAREYRNPDQLDQDGDDFGDVRDLCPLLASDNNTADSDHDAIGNACDLCPNPTAIYNEVFGLGVEAKMFVRNIPSHADFDQDGIGDVCDNCVMVPNCQDYGPDNPAPMGAEAGNAADCQLDDDADGIGNACEAELMPLPESAGPIGFSGLDDFDQDGLTNAEDHCPRLASPSSTICNTDEDCGAEFGDGYECATTLALDGNRRCNHLDSDGDNVGDACDTCPASPNPMQITDGGMQLDDEDGDFIGADCETNIECTIRRDVRQIGFYDISVGGHCCVTTWPGDDALHDPEGVPIRLDCTSEQEQSAECRKLPASVAAMPGVVELAPGCEAKLSEAALEEATPYTLADFDGDAAALWGYACLMPAWDQDFDGLGDSCDLCRYGFDPLNEPYVDDMGTLWPDAGKVCFGDYATDLVPGAACEWP